MEIGQELEKFQELRHRQRQPLKYEIHLGRVKTKLEIRLGARFFLEYQVPPDWHRSRGRTDLSAVDGLAKINKKRINQLNATVMIN